MVMAIHHRWRLYPLISAALLSLLVLTGNARGQTEGSPLEESGPQVEVCTGQMSDGSGMDIVTAMAFTPEGSRLLLGCKSGAVELRTLEGQLLFRQEPNHDFVQSVAVTPNGRLFLSASGNTVRLWNGKGDPQGSFTTGDSPINAMAVAADGRNLLTGHDDTSGLLWSLEGVLLRRFEDPGPFPTFKNRVVQLAFYPADGDIVLGHASGTLRRWSPAGRLISEIDSGIETLKALSITANGDVVAAGWYGARRWDSSGKPQGSLREDGGVDALQLLPDGKAVVLAGSANGDGYLEMRDLSGRTLLNVQPPPASPDGPLVLSPDGRVLVMAVWNQLSRWDLPAASL